MHNHDNKEAKPLYKVLNEKRTPGILQLEENPFWGNRIRVNTPDNETGLTTIFVVEDYTENKEQAKANAQYTALAVNNLHILTALAEHITDMGNDAYLEGHPEWNEIVKQAKEALKKIS